MVVANVLSELLEASLFRRALFAHLHLGSPWAVRFPRTVGAKMHIVLGAPATLEVAGHPPVALHDRELAVVTRGLEHAISCGASNGDPSTLAELRARHDPGGDTHLLCGRWELEGPCASLFGALPDVLVLPTTGALARRIDLLVELLATEMSDERDRGARDQSPSERSAAGLCAARLAGARRSGERLGERAA